MMESPKKLRLKWPYWVTETFALVESKYIEQYVYLHFKTGAFLIFLL